MTYKFLKSRSLTAIIYAACLLFAINAFSQQTVSASLQLKLLSNVLKFDRNFHKKIKDDAPAKISILIIYQSKVRESFLFLEELKSSAAENSEFDIVVLDLDTEKITNNKKLASSNVWWIAPLRAIDINEISTLSRNKRRFTVASEPKYVPLGISLGFDIKGEKPQILLNRSQAEKEGAKFESTFLNLVTIIE